jgi:hypothetical protein
MFRTIDTNSQRKITTSRARSARTIGLFRRESHKVFVLTYAPIEQGQHETAIIMVTDTGSGS